MSDPELGISPEDRARAAIVLADHLPLLGAVRAEDVATPSLTPEAALSLSARVQTLAERGPRGPHPFEADYYEEVAGFAHGPLFEDALAFAGAAAAGQSDLAARAFTLWATRFDAVVRLGRYFAEDPRRWPEPLLLLHAPVPDAETAPVQVAHVGDDVTSGELP
ncbi:MAG: hypothetical protein U1F43_37685 [Myxococcota bacterium]